MAIDHIVLPTGSDLPDGDYVLGDGAAWFTVGRFAIRVYSLDDSVWVQIFKDGAETEVPLASASATL